MERKRGTYSENRTDSPKGKNSKSRKNCITDIEGVTVGQISDKVNMTGCTVVLLGGGAVCGAEVCGGAPGSRETSLLASEKANDAVHAIFLSGGSAYGISVGDGIMRYLEEQGIGFDTDYGLVPIVPGAVLFDLEIGSPSVRPDAEMGYRACQNAAADKIKEGNEGAGTGATVGKIKDEAHMMKGGIGSASYVGENGLTVGAIAAVNALGDIVDPQTGQQLAGPVFDGQIRETAQIMRENLTDHYRYKRNNTTIAIVGTNARLDKAQCNLLASMAAHGLIRTVRPAGTSLDGDTVFAFSKGGMECDINTLGVIAADVLSQAIRNAIRAAEEVAGVPAYRTIRDGGRR